MKAIKVGRKGRPSAEERLFICKLPNATIIKKLMTGYCNKNKMGKEASSLPSDYAKNLRKGPVDCNEDRELLLALRRVFNQPSFILFLSNPVYAFTFREFLESLLPRPAYAVEIFGSAMEDQVISNF